MQDDLRDKLVELLSEPLEQVKGRERNEFDQRIGETKRLLLFGAGKLGRRALSVMRESGLAPDGFIDNNAALWGSRIDGLEVASPSVAAGRFDVRETAVVTTIWCGEASDKMSDRIKPLHTLGFKHVALFGHLAWKHPELFLPHYSLDLPSRAMEQSARILRAFDLFQDRSSREIFLSHVEWRLHLDYDALPVPVTETIYFNKKVIRPSSTEFFVDGGAFDGDTVKSFLDTYGKNGFHKVISFEPDPLNFPKLQSYVMSLPRETAKKIIVYPCALGEVSSRILVESSGGSSSRVGHGHHEVACHTIDEFADDAASPSFIKLDIEGFEIQALKGARHTIKEKAPVLSVCAYHVQNHLWELPLLIHEMRPDYQYRYVPHLSDGWDLVLYAAPPDRIVDSF